MQAEMLPPERELAANQKPELKRRHFLLVVTYVGSVAVILCALVFLGAILSIVFVGLAAGMLVVIIPAIFLIVQYQQSRKR